MDGGVVLELSSGALYGDTKCIVGWFWSLVVGLYGDTKWIVGWFWSFAVGLYGDTTWIVGWFWSLVVGLYTGILSGWWGSFGA